MKKVKKTKNKVSLSARTEWMMHQTQLIIHEMAERYKENCQEEEDRRRAEEDRRRSEEEERRQKEEERRRAEEDRRRAEEEERRQKEEERRQKEIERVRMEMDRRKEESDKLMEEVKKQIKEAGLEIKEAGRKIKELSTKYSSQIGHVVEGLMEPSALALFQQAGFDIIQCWKNMKCHRKNLNKGMEIDLFLHDTVEAVAVEVKTNCKRDDVDYFVKKMEDFDVLFPLYAGVNVYMAVAAINFDYGADKYAAEKGLFVIRVNEDDFVLDSAKKEDMTYYNKGKKYEKSGLA